MIAQAVPIVISPLLTRLYSPNDFGIFSLYMAIVSVASIIAAGRYELAIVIADTDKKARDLSILSVLLAFFFSLIFFIILMITLPLFSNVLIDEKNSSGWILFAPISIFLMASFNVSQMWLNRGKEYRSMSKLRVRNSFSNALLSLASGGVSVSIGMILGNIVGFVVALLWDFNKKLQETKRFISVSSTRSLLGLANTYRSYPLFVVPSQLVGNVAVYIPVAFVASNYSLSEAGFFGLAYRLVTLPTGLVANAIGDVFRERAARSYNESGGFRRVYLKTVTYTCTLGIIPFVTLYISSPVLFSWLFGESWLTAGEFAQILIFSAFFQFVFTPTDKGALIVGALRYIFFWQSLRLFLILCVSCSAYFYSWSVTYFLIGLVSSNILLYTFDGAIEFHFSKRGDVGGK